MNLEKIANLIKTKRKENNLTQKELASKLNVTEKAISRWETKRGTPDISLLIPLAKELNVNVTEILTGEYNTNQNIEEIIKYIDISKKSKDKYLILTIVIYVILLLTYLTYLKFEYNPKIVFIYYTEIIFNLFFIFQILLANKIMTNYYFEKIADKEKMKKFSFILLLIIYIIFILNYTIFKRNIGETRINLIPFKTISEYIIYREHFNNDIIIKNILGNILIFMPIGYLVLKIKTSKNFKPIFIIGFIIAFSIEFLQYITHTGIADIDDLILNLSGISLIYLIYIIIAKIKSRLLKT